MSEQTASPEEIVEKGGEALDNILNQELGSADSKPTADGANAPETKGATNADEANDAEQPAEESEKPAEGEKSPKDEDKKDDEPENDGKKGDDGAAERKSGKKKSRYAKKVEKLLSKKNDAEKRVEAAEQRIAELEAKLNEKESADDSTDEKEHDDSETEKDSKDDAKSDDLEEDPDDEEDHEAVKAADEEEREQLINKYDPSAKELKEVDALIKKYPGMTDAEALKLVNPTYFVEGAQLNKAGAKKLGSGARPRRDLRKEPSPKNMSDKELDQELARQLSSGELVL